MDSSKLKITRARENNLKDVSLEIPHDELVVFTGISGSGKSSLAFDTVYAEGQRRYIETFSPYTRQFLDRVKHPNVDSVENVRPAIAIQQRTRILSSRSTVGSMTNCNDYLKLLWANLAEPVCPGCGKPFDLWKAAALANKIIAECADTKKTLLIATHCDFDKKPFDGERERLTALGFSRFFRGQTRAVTPLEEATKNDLINGALLVVLDRVREGATGAATAKRLRESIEQAYSLGGNTAVVIDPASKEETYREFSAVPRCKKCNLTVARARPALFSYNHPLGACPECKGFGKILEISHQKIVPNPMLSLSEKALQCWASEGTRGELRKLLTFCKAQGISTTTPWLHLPLEQQKSIFTHRSREYRGVLPWFKGLERKLYKMHVRVFLAKYRSQVDCSVCGGTRFKPDSLAYRIEGKTIADTSQMPIAELLPWIATVDERETAQGKVPRQLKDIFKATRARLQYLQDLGLSYLTLDRQSRTLSGGETQRVNLATALGSDLISTHFVLDEPSVGLHARDTERLMNAVRGLQTRGNSVLVVEHDPDFINSADHIVELGPEAGVHGGEIIFNGPRGSWNGLDTARVLPQLSAGRPFKKQQKLSITNATSRNLKALSVTIPLHQFVCLTGVSGSGKSSLVHEVIKRGYDHAQMGMPRDSDENLVSGFEHISQLLLVDQSPLAKSPRANIATYTGIWDEVRSLLAGTEDAQSRALSKSAFSFNVAGGRCPACDGAGFVREDMQFLSDVYIQCEVCLGRRFQETVLEVTFKGKNAHDFLQMSIEECLAFFPEGSSVASAANTLKLLGLGHLTLGHPLSELSGGEAQRLKLVPFIQQSNAKPSLLIFDEPTTGLHAYDVLKLIALCKMLRDRGHSVLCIEHNLALIAACDWIIDLGPEGGAGGGTVVAEGTPAEFIDGNVSKNSYTAAYLSRFVREVGKAKATAARTKRTSLPAPRVLSIRGAREHNLKNIDVDIPLNEIVAFTGVSGSGKSSIAKDIVYAEGQRRYLDCLSPYARQFIQELKRPEIDSISNVKPSICVYQHTFQPSRFSTVGTMSESYNYLRLLYAKVATQYCPDHPAERISPLSAHEIAAAIAGLSAKTVRLLAPVIKMKKGNHRAVLERAVAAEFSQVRIDGVFLSPATLSFSGGLEKNKPHTIEFVVGKFSPQTAPLDLVRDAVAQALSLGGGNVIVHTDKGETLYSVERTCPVCKRGFFKPDPEDLSFHSKRGRCPECDGAGVYENGKVCKSCGGSRLNELGRNLRLSGRNISEASALTAPTLEEFLRALTFSEREKAISEPV
ncbi:MAG: excinuclease ABC subunit A, partial [Proteobacteria bacterium]|nr:excinuclease ABC subunit A [Pseudomonadota bacterium]